MPKIATVLIIFVGSLFFNLAISANSNIKINEFVSDVDVASGEKEWVEFYNPGSSDQPLPGWFIEERTGSDLSGVSSYPLDSIIVPAEGFAVYEFSGSKLNNSGDILALKNGSIKIDEVAYGSAPNSQVDAPDKNQSAGRKTDGSNTWVVFDSSTKNGSNNFGQEAVEPSPPSSLNSSSSQTSSTAKSPSPSPKSSPSTGTSKTSSQKTSSVLGSSSSEATKSPTLEVNLSASPTPSVEPKAEESSNKMKIAGTVAGSGAIIMGISVGLYLWYRKRLATGDKNKEQT